MSKIDLKSELFQYKEENGAAILTLKGKAKDMYVSLEDKGTFLDALTEIQNKKTIQGIVVINSIEYPGDLEYEKLLREILQNRSFEVTQINLSRAINATIQLVEYLKKLSLPIIVGMDGTISAGSLGFYMACDMRIATKQTTFVHPNIQLGLPPSGAYSFFLSRHWGPTKTFEHLVTKSKIGAEEALKEGLLTEIVENEEIEKACIAKCSQLAKNPNKIVAKLREYYLPDSDDIRAYMEALDRKIIISSR